MVVIEYLSVQQVTPAGHRLDQKMIVVTKCAAQLPNALHQRIVGYNDVAPDCPLEFFLPDKSPGVLHQMKQHLECLGPQFEISVT